jgi:SOS response regulatory protein OraA/RecX
VRRRSRGGDSAGPPEPRERPRDPVAMACRYLAVSERCAAQVRDYLRRKGFEAEEADRTIDLLKERRLVNDLRFARLYVESRCRRSPRSRALLVKELRIKGVEAETARQVVSDFLREVPEEELARRVLSRLPAGGPDARERAARRLRSRGFGTAAALEHGVEHDDPGSDDLDGDDSDNEEPGNEDHDNEDHNNENLGNQDPDNEQQG